MDNKIDSLSELHLIVLSCQPIKNNNLCPPLSIRTARTLYGRRAQYSVSDNGYDDYNFNYNKNL